jgi:hypothetical protein
MALPSKKKAETTKYRALYPYYSEHDYELSFAVNDIIEVVNKFEDDNLYDGWWSGKIAGRIGLFPIAYCEEIKVKKMRVATKNVSGTVKAIQMMCGFHKTAAASKSIS